MILIKVAYCVVWGCVDFKNIKRNKKGSPKFVAGIVTLLRDKSVLFPKPPALPSAADNFKMKPPAHVLVPSQH